MLPIFFKSGILLLYAENDLIKKISFSVKRNWFKILIENFVVQF